MKNLKLFAIFFLITTMACTKDSGKDKLAVKSLNFFGCDKSLKSSSEKLNCAVKYELIGNKLKIIRSAKLNCGTDSFSVQIDEFNNSINIYETDYATRAAFCNCNMTYEYVVGPLYLKEYEIKIISPNNEKYLFNLNLDSLVSGNICN